jgi:hypothetical protein
VAGGEGESAIALVRLLQVLVWVERLEGRSDLGEVLL